jgi:hypothetical protein
VVGPLQSFIGTIQNMLNKITITKDAFVGFLKRDIRPLSPFIVFSSFWSSEILLGSPDHETV